jgi:23S rRNA pseudouridine2605 synthase
LASRRAAEELLREGRVRVNDVVASLGDSADPEGDVVAVDGVRLQHVANAYWMLHKPRGVLTTVRDPEGRETVLDLLPADAPRLFPVGRLDRDTEGLVLLTNDGALAHVLLHPSFESEREYRVSVRGRVATRSFERLATGVRLVDGLTAPARVEVARFDEHSQTTRFSLTLTEGKKRQIRRALAALGHPVTSLLRVRMGTLRLGGLPRGKARPLSARELRALRRLVAARAEAAGRA